MAKVHLVTEAQAIPAQSDETPGGAKLIRPVRAVLILAVAHTTDEWPLEGTFQNGIALALSPHLAKKIAREMLDAAEKMEKSQS